MCCVVRAPTISKRTTKKEIVIEVQQQHAYADISYLWYFPKTGVRLNIITLEKVYSLHLEKRIYTQVKEIFSRTLLNERDF